MTTDELQEFLATIDPTCQPVTFISETLPKWKSARNQFDYSNGRGKGRTHRVYKVARINGMIGARYSSCVERAAVREAIQSGADTFEVPTIGPRRWGKRIEGTPLVHHVNAKGVQHYYLDFLPIRTLDRRFLLDEQWATTKEEAEIVECMAATTAPKGVVWRNYRLDHLHSMRVCRELIVVDGFQLRGTVALA